MGDRCWMQITLHGNIDSPKTLVKVAQAILAENFVDEFERPPENLGARTILDMIADYMAHRLCPQFHSDQVNYGNIDVLEEALRKLDVAHAIDQGAGDGYGARCWSWQAGNECDEALCDHDGDPVIMVSRLRRALDKENPLQAITALVEEAERAYGKGLPAFSVSGRAEKFLAKRAAIKALKVA
jgi:hypothetical protein